jgi:hypothetical protein
MLPSGPRRSALLSRRGLTATMILAPLVGIAFVAGTEQATSDAQEAAVRPARPVGAASGGHASAVQELGGPAGFGPVSASGPDNSLLAVRTRTGIPGTALTAPGAGGSAGKSAQTGTGRTQWREAGSLFAGAPADVRTGPDGAGSGLAALGLDGRLYWAQPDGRGSVAAWHPVG